MKLTVPTFFTVVSIFALAACSVMPTGPSILVLPGPGKNFDEFRSDNLKCRQYALGQIGGVSTSQAAATNAATGTAVSADAGGAKASGYDAQESYDMSYIQCMFASGNRVPVSGTFIDDSMLGGDEFPFPAPLPPPESLLPPPNQ